jgi:hypothetical protein
LIDAGGRKIRFEIHERMNSIWNKKELPEEEKESVIVAIYKKGVKQIVVIVEAYHFCQSRAKLYPISCCEGGEGQLLIMYFAFVK